MCGRFLFLRGFGGCFKGGGVRVFEGQEVYFLISVADYVDICHKVKVLKGFFVE